MCSQKLNNRVLSTSIIFEVVLIVYVDYRSEKNAAIVIWLPWHVPGSLTKLPSALSRLRPWMF